MSKIDKKSLSEADIRTNFITPAIENAGWDLLSQGHAPYGRAPTHAVHTDPAQGDDKRSLFAIDAFGKLYGSSFLWDLRDEFPTPDSKADGGRRASLVERNRIGRLLPCLT